MDHHPVAVLNCRALSFFSVLLLALLCFGFPMPMVAQVNANAAQQQRPRRASEVVLPATQSASTKTHPEEIDSGDVVRVNTQLVSVPVAVANREGRPVTGLGAASFLLYEDNRPQQIANFSTTDAPFEVAMLLDTSGSTRAEVALISRAAQAFVDALRPGDRVAVISFNTSAKGDAGAWSKLATVDVKSRLTSSRPELREAINSLGSSSGTPYYDALLRVVQEVFHDPPGEQFRGRRALVALTDGVDSTSDSDFSEAREDLVKAGIICYFVQVNTEDFVEDRLIKDCEEDGTLRLSPAQLRRYHNLFDPRSDASEYRDFCKLGPFERMEISRALYNLARKEMRDLARDTGGKDFPVADLHDARAAFAQVAKDIGTQYSLGYYPQSKNADGRFHQIRVVVRGVDGATVRAREGYQAARGSS